MPEEVNTLESVKQKTQGGKTTKNASGSRLSREEAVHVVVNTAVAMSGHEPDIDIRSLDESRRGPGILIWIPGYIWNDGQIVAALGELPPQGIEGHPDGGGNATVLEAAQEEHHE